MFSYVLSGGVHGIDSYIVQVEADISEGMPMFELVGYLGSEVREARERVRTALKNAGFSLPIKRVTVNLSPANIRKQGTGFDLPVAVSLLIAMEVVPKESVIDTVFAGELLLSGKVGSITGALPITLAAKRGGMKRCILPIENAAESMTVDGVEVIGVESLTQLTNFLQGRECIMEKKDAAASCVLHKQSEFGFQNIQGQHFAKRGLEIAAAGRHNVLMMGPPGAGKTMLAKCIPTILPPLSSEESLEVSAIYSVAGKLCEKQTKLIQPPFVNPHHTVTEKALTGGSSYLRPGCVSLAHKGVLFLDEMPEFSRNALEALRQPLEDKVIHIVRASGDCVYPADFMLVGAMNPCPCGAYPDLKKCMCTETARKHYMAKISKPFLDRMDICMEIPRIEYKDLTGNLTEESSENIRERVVRARKIQATRFSKEMYNSGMGVTKVREVCFLDTPGRKLIESAFEQFCLSARAYHRILKTARTIADLDESTNICERHLAEAIHYRMIF